MSLTHAFNPSTWEAKTGGFLSSRPALSTEGVPGQPGLCRETLSRKQTNKSQKKKKKKKQPNNKNIGSTPQQEAQCLSKVCTGSKAIHLYPGSQAGGSAHPKLFGSRVTGPCLSCYLPWNSMQRRRVVKANNCSLDPSRPQLRLQAT